MNLPVWKNLFRIKRAEEEIVPPLPNVEREFVLRCGQEGKATSRATPESISRAILSLCLQNGWGIVQNDEGAFTLLNLARRGVEQFSDIGVDLKFFLYAKMPQVR